MKLWYRLYFLLLFSLLVPPVFANVYGVTPVQLSLSKKQRIGVISLTNQSDENSLLQLSLVDWQQKDGKDIYKISHDILMTPPLFRLPAHKTQVIRFALKHPIFNTLQKTYRLHIKEIDQGRKEKLGQTLYFLMDLSLPLFVEPDSIIEKFVWLAERTDTQHIKVKLYNEGNVTLFTNQWRLLNSPRNLMIAKQSTFAYILPGQSHSWVVAINSNAKPTDIESTINGQRKRSVLHLL